MADKNISVDSLQLRYDAATAWASKNPTLLLGEWGLDTTNKILKVGDGATPWNSLSEFSGVRGASIYPTTSSVSNISQISGMKVGDSILNSGSAAVTILGNSTPIGGIVKASSATAGSIIGNIRGAVGTPGQDGVDGAPGAPGAPGRDGQDGATGAQGRGIYLTTSAVSNISSISGMRVGDYLVNGGASALTLLGRSVAIGGIVEATSATASVDRGNIRGAAGEPAVIGDSVDIGRTTLQQGADTASVTLPNESGYIPVTASILTKGRALISSTSSTAQNRIVVSTTTNTELGYLSGVTSSVQDQLNAKAASSHNHNASDINAGTLAIARIPTGTTSSTVCVGNDSRLSDSRTPTSHASSSTTYGVGTSTNYGHVRLASNLTTTTTGAYALDAYQGYVLSTSLNAFSNALTTFHNQMGVYAANISDTTAGRIYLYNGLLIQWGTITPAASSSGSLVTFPYAYYSTSHYKIVAQNCKSGATDGGSTAYPRIFSRTSTGFRIANAASSYWAEECHWIAIGYAY